jgi:hypothetical protein
MGKRYKDPDELQAAVIAECRDELTKMMGRPWTDDDTVLIVGDWRRDRALYQQRALKVLRRLSGAMKEACDFVAQPMPEGVGQISQFLNAFVPLYVKPLLDRGVYDRADGSLGLSLLKSWHADYENEIETVEENLRTRIAKEWPNLNGAKTTVRQLALLSLMAGLFPKLKDAKLGHTVSTVIDAEYNGMLQARKRVEATPNVGNAVP